jgi:hypothetical protein
LLSHVQHGASLRQDTAWLSSECGSIEEQSVATLPELPR